MIITATIILGKLQVRNSPVVCSRLDTIILGKLQVRNSPVVCSRLSQFFPCSSSSRVPAEPGQDVVEPPRPDHMAVQPQRPGHHLSKLDPEARSELEIESRLVTFSLFLSISLFV